MEKGTKLNIREKQKVSYAIPLWLRDEQIKSNIARTKGRIKPCYDLRQGPVAVVGFGPSLKDTWEKLRDFQYIITCSGSHRFLIDRSIIPTWHVEVDPREYKIQLLGEPHQDVEYLVASTCHPKYLEHLKDYNVKLWHVFDTSEEGQRILPPGEWAITGGCDVGLRAVTIARFLGFTQLHIFGIDGSSPDCDSGRHAEKHPNPVKAVCQVEYEGRTFNSTPAMVEAARAMWHELDLLKDTEATFYGDGLVQHMAKFYEKKPKSDMVVPIAASKPELISGSLRELNAQLHRDNLAYGVGGGNHAETVIKLRDSINASSVLDYGAGKGYLAKALPFPIWEYDPAIPEKSACPRPADLVICTDVLEHVEPDKLLFVLDDLRRCTKKVVFLSISTGPAIKHYADGRNTHLIQEGKDWWELQLSKFFIIGKTFCSPGHIMVVAAPKAMPQPPSERAMMAVGEAVV